MSWIELYLLNEEDMPSPFNREGRMFDAAINIKNTSKNPEIRAKAYKLAGKLLPSKLHWQPIDDADKRLTGNRSSSKKPEDWLSKAIKDMEFKVSLYRDKWRDGLKPRVDKIWNEREKMLKAKQTAEMMRKIKRRLG